MRFSRLRSSDVETIANSQDPADFDYSTVDGSRSSTSKAVGEVVGLGQ